MPDFGLAAGLEGAGSQHLPPRPGGSGRESLCERRSPPGPGLALTSLPKTLSQGRGRMGLSDPATLVVDSGCASRPPPLFARRLRERKPRLERFEGVERRDTASRKARGSSSYSASSAIRLGEVGTNGST